MYLSPLLVSNGTNMLTFSMNIQEIIKSFIYKIITQVVEIKSMILSLELPCLLLALTDEWTDIFF